MSCCKSTWIHEYMVGDGREHVGFVEQNEKMRRSRPLAMFRWADMRATR